MFEKTTFLVQKKKETIVCEQFQLLKNDTINEYNKLLLIHFNKKNHRGK